MSQGKSGLTPLPNSYQIWRSRKYWLYRVCSVFWENNGNLASLQILESILSFHEVIWFGKTKKHISNFTFLQKQLKFGEIKTTDIHHIYRVAGICMVSDHVLGPLVNSRTIFLLFTCLSLRGTWHLNSFTSLFLRLSNPSRLPLSSCKPCDVVYISSVGPFNFEKIFHNRVRDTSR